MNWFGEFGEGASLNSPRRNRKIPGRLRRVVTQFIRGFSCIDDQRRAEVVHYVVVIARGFTEPEIERVFTGAKAIAGEFQACRPRLVRSREN